MKALKTHATPDSSIAVLSDLPIPTLPSPEWILIRTIAVALNPTDWKTMKQLDVQATVGCDFAGVVEEVGTGVSKELGLKKGSRVCGAVHGCCRMHGDRGAFGEWIVAKGDLVVGIPDGESFEEAAPVGISLLTVGQGMYQEMGLPKPDAPLKEKIPILIYGGSSSVGAVAIQFAKLSGFEVLTTCSKSNFDYVKRLGADHVFDARDPDIGTKIRSFTDDKLYYAFDCLTEYGSPAQCANALASSAPPGQELRYGNIQVPDGGPRQDVINTFSNGFTATGEECEMQIAGNWIRIGGNKDHYEFMRDWLALAGKLFAEGKWKPHRVEVGEGGLEAVLGGLDDLEEGRVSGVKLVYRVWET